MTANNNNGPFLSDQELQEFLSEAGLIIAGSITAIALHTSGDVDKAKQAAAVTTVVAGTALVFSRNQ